MRKGVAEAAESGDRLATLTALVDTLTSAIAVVPDEQVPALAARLVEVLRHIGGPDLSVLVDLRLQLARAVDRLALLQGEVSDKGAPLGTALAPMVHQLVDVVEVLATAPAARKVSKRDDLAERRARRGADAAAVAVAGKGRRKRGR